MGLVIPFVAAVGMAVGSFVSAAVYRLTRGITVVRGRSRCPHCQHVLGAADLVPLVSYVWSRGRCRYCGLRISPMYPVLEAACASGFVLLWLASATPAMWVVRATLFTLLVALVLTDLQAGTLPDALTVTGLMLATGFAAAGWSVGLSQALVGAAVGAATILVIVWASRGGMGLGDAKMLAMIGAFLGPWGALGTLVWGSFLGSVVGVGLLLTGRATRKTKLPFGPFLAAGALLAQWTVPLWLRFVGLGAPHGS
ncbi:MAG: prepilin peptidase [Limnochordaceae bacterium]|nr:prepilin peptidase [Limnochordaceae bacterium]